MEPGTEFPLRYSFRLPGGGLLKVTFDATIESEEHEHALYWVRLGRWHELQSPAGQAPAADIVDKLDALVGKRARIPEEATRGTRLPMKYRTLTREMRYFYD